MPSRYLDVPVFRDGLRVRPVLYQLDSVVTHVGSVPSRGHYQALLYDDGDRDSVYFADDGMPAKRVAMAGVSRMSNDMYLFVYRKCL